MKEPFLTSRELANRWKIKIITLKQWRCSGKGPYYHKLGGRIMYRINEIEQFEERALRAHTSMDSFLLQQAS